MEIPSLDQQGNIAVPMRYIPALACLLVADSLCAHGDNVLFYAGFEGHPNAVSAGDGTARAHDGEWKFRPGKRGQALLSGDGYGYVSYAVENNIRTDRGSIELWVSPVDWEGNNDKFHVFFEAETPGWLLLYKYLGPGSGMFLLSELHQTWQVAKQDIGHFKPGHWHHLVATWNSPQALFYLDGKPSEPVRNPPLPQGLTGRFLVGDRPWHLPRNARSLIDELYIYDRALDEKEVLWAFENAAVRPPGKEIPVGIATPVRIRAQPYPSRREIHVDIRLDPRRPLAGFTGAAGLTPAAGTKTARVRALTDGHAEAVIPFRELPGGEYRVRVEIADADGNHFGSATDTVLSSGPSPWKGNRIGIPKTPPHPWTPLATKGKPGKSPFTVSCWGRSYQFGPLGLPEQITSLQEPLLSGPVELRAVRNGREVTWRPQSAKLANADAVGVVASGRASSELGRLDWRLAAEFDGMVRYDLTLHPADGAETDRMELRVPLDARRITLRNVVRGYPPSWQMGALPASNGVLETYNWALHWWLGNEEKGLAGFCESDEAWDQTGRSDGFRIERDGDSVAAVWSFHRKPRKLDTPWKFTFGLQATPVKDITGWRKWRPVPATNENVWITWPYPDTIRFYGFPAPTDPAKFRSVVRERHERGIQVVPYSLINGLSSTVPEWSFHGAEWANGVSSGTDSDVKAYNAPLMGCSPSRDWTDFIVWANHRFVTEHDLDGLYHDWTEVYPSDNALSGCGYVRDGKRRATYPVFGTRQLYKRIYTMLKEHGRARNRETLMAVHLMGTRMIVPVVSFSDGYLDGEYLSTGLKDSYLDLLSLDHIRAHFMGHNFGIPAFFLPQFKGEFARRVEPTQHMAGLMLLHDISPWNLWCHKLELDRILGVLDGFGLVDAQFLPYWNNADLIRGQSDLVKASAYRKPDGGALLVVVNTDRQPQKAALSVDWSKLKSSQGDGVADAFSNLPIPLEGASVTVEIAPLSFRLLRVR
jgi:hypothetical protein